MKILKSIRNLMSDDLISEEISGCKIEITHKGAKSRVIISGRKRVSSHTHSETVIAAENTEIKICGIDLTCNAYTHGALEICGTIKSIIFNEVSH